MEFKKIYTINNTNNEQNILGVNNTNIKLLENKFGINITYRNLEFYTSDEVDIEEFAKMLKFIEELLDHGVNIEYRDLLYILQTLNDETIDKLRDLYYIKEVVVTNYNGRQIYAKTLNQRHYIKCLKNNDIIFGVGPAGTGKTFIAVNYAVNLLKNNKIKKIVLVRPVVEAGEKLGFLPGDLKDKIDPYLIPLYDALNDALGKEKVDFLIEKGIIEIAPLAYMRGRTLDNAVIILDESQNATTTQMKMFLTRLGFNSKMFITGDLTQIDLDRNKLSGLMEAVRILKDIDNIKIINFDEYDVMRHPLVHEIIKRYEERYND